MTERDDRPENGQDNGQDGGLEAFFAAARAETPAPAPDFMARLAEDAVARMPRGPGLWPQLKAALGGWAGMTGLATACAAGLWIGISPPTALDVLWGEGAGLGALGLDPLGGFELAMMEG